MATYTIALPDGGTLEVEGPENATDEQLIAVAQQEIARQKPGKEYATPVVDRTTGTAPQAALIGAGDFVTAGFLDEIGAGLETILPGRHSYWNAPDGRSLKDQFDLNLQQWEGARQDIAASRPGAYTVGQVGGAALSGVALSGLGATNALARLGPRGSVLAGEAIQGAAYGAGSQNNDRVKGAAIGGVLGPAGGIAGRSALGAVSNVVAPVVPAAVRTLSRAGVTMTPGQIFGQGGWIGRSIRGLEERLQGLPVADAVIGGAKRQGVEEFNRAAFKEGLEPIAAEIPPNTPPGRALSDWAQETASEAYDAALRPLNLRADDEFAYGMADVMAGVQSLADDQIADVERALARHVAPYGGDVIDGEGLQAIKQGLSKEIGKYRAPGAAPRDHDVADALEQFRDEFMNLAYRQAPESASAYRAADAAFGNVAILDKASAKATKDGVFSPLQLSQAVRESDKTARKRSFAAGKARLQGLADAGSQVLPSVTPDSGSIGRLALYGALGGGALGGGSYAADADASTSVLAGLAVAAPFTPVGRRALQTILIDRPDAAIRLAEQLRTGSALAGRTGTGAALIGGSALGLIGN